MSAVVHSGDGRETTDDRERAERRWASIRKRLLNDPTYARGSEYGGGTRRG